MTQNYEIDTHAMNPGSLTVSKLAYWRLAGMAERGMAITPEILCEFREAEPGELPEDWPLSAKDVAEGAKCTPDWVRKLAPEMAEEGFAKKLGREWRFAEGASLWLMGRKDNRGRKKEQLSRAEMGEAVRRDALFLDAHDPGKTERVYVLIWQGHVADRRGDILPPTGREQDLIGWGNKWDGPAAGFGYDSGAIWVPKKYLV